MTHYWLTNFTGVLVEKRACSDVLFFAEASRVQPGFIQQEESGSEGEYERPDVNATYYKEAPDCSYFLQGPIAKRHSQLAAV